MKKAVIIILSLLAILDAAFIYYNSSQTSTVSRKVSKEISSQIVEITDKNFEQKEYDEKVSSLVKTNIELRKYAHLAEFASLAFLLCLIGLIAPVKLKSMILFMFVAYVSSVVYGFIDELHKLFVDGRTFQWNDITVDIYGCTIGMILAVLVYSVYLIIKRNKKGVA